MYEADLPSLQPCLFGRLCNGEWRKRWEFWNRAPSRHGIALEAMPSRVSDVWEAMRTVYQDVARRKGATIWGEKTHWCDGALRLAEVFPDASFIFLWRDISEVMAGIATGALTERFYRKRGLRLKALLGSEKLKQACDALKIQGRRVHEVYYEDLAADTANCIRRICEFLEVGFESAMTSLKGSDRSSIGGHECQHHAGLWHDRIALEKERNDLISPALSLKIDRYIRRWKKLYDGKWPKYPLDCSQAGNPPDALELGLDRITYRCLIAWDQVIKVMYALAPLAVGRAFRLWLHERTVEPYYSTSIERSREKIEIPG